MFAKPSLIAAGLALGLSTLAPSAAEAHRRWLLPSATVMAGEEETVTVDAAASNGLFIFEHRPLGLDDLVVIGPDGQSVTPEIIGSGAYRSVFDLKLESQGTYRIAIASNGMMGFYELNGERRRWRGSRAELETAIPEGATDVRISENSGRTETFVTLGAPNETALAPTNVGLEMIPVTHPNDLIAGEPAQMRFLMDGEPAAGLELEFVAGGTRYRDEPGIQTLTTDADGMVTLSADEAGMYYLEASAGRGEYEEGTARRMSYTAVLEFMPL
ncbi:DUF4198 domain-containing protein [Alteriqipengyuania lutimaris]|uniref:DUF4198 domain-containing protein n=1 Tax=Alteriqipengyuania lutimaris TaxID=1538146 RepID=A0A395LN31_9SPHN|nr:DUF4198 domain-containing protein [Alteriqipengyuania lutimaris]MBB3032416.1 hypothetical protein [Alteriqipengyuania lutimaris]RDS78438.1 DUF4198 domain-containing protein [Alteriqipengyuania lutimaris]